MSRKMICSGSFYPSNQVDCIADIERYVDLANSDRIADIPEKLTGAIVPHAGWNYCGDVLGEVFGCIENHNRDIQSFILLGAIHSRGVLEPTVYLGDSWDTPLGPVEIDQEISDAFATKHHFKENLSAHSIEHSLEVPLPFIKKCFPEAKICAILVPSFEESIEVGKIVRQIIKDFPEKKVFCIASSDLTHYGPHYHFMPVGDGEDGYKWAKNVNDKAFINATLSMNSHKALSKGVNDRSACGAGAVAAVVEYAKLSGVCDGKLLKHTHSYEVVKSTYLCCSVSTVGYAGIVF